MTQPVKVFLLTLAAIATFWAAVSLATGFDGDFKAAAVIAILALGATQFIDYRDSEQLRQRYLWECGREAVWERRERECQADR